MTTTNDLDWSRDAVLERLKTFRLDARLLADIASLESPKLRRSAMDYASRMEWHKCAEDIIYWLDPSQHFTSAQYPEGTPYVFTQERKALFACVSCNNGLLYNADKQSVHLEIKHGLKLEKFKDISQHFRELDRTRVFNLLPYMPEILEWIQREPVIMIEKSRDMMATWLAVTYFAWDVLFHTGKQVCFQSLTSNKTKEAVERVFFIWRNQPAFLKKQHLATFSAANTRAGQLVIPSLGSEIIGLPRGADQIRQYHPSGVFSDEAAFQIEAGELFTAVKAAVMGGGKYIAVSSANPGWFQFATSDRLDD